MKKFIIFLIICVAGFFNIQPSIVVKADDGNDIEKELSQSIVLQLDNLNLDDLDACLSSVSEYYNFSSTMTAKELLTNIASGTYFSSYDNIFDAIVNMLFNNLKSLVPLVFLIIGVALLGSILNTVKGNGNSSSVNDLIHFVCYAVIVLIVCGVIINCMTKTSEVLKTMNSQISIIFPIMLTLLTAVGGVSSVGIYKPVIAILTSGVGFIFSNFLFPIFVLSFIFLVVSNLSKSIKLNNFNNFLSSMFKTVIGFTVTLFTAFLTIQGISAGKFDGISIKATKYAVKSYVPIIGSFISDSFDLIMCSSVIIKNAVGVIGLLMIAGLIITPIVQILILKLALQLVSAILEPVSDGRISSFCSGCSKILIYPIVLILAVAFMYILSIALIMTTANIL